MFRNRQEAGKLLAALVAKKLNARPADAALPTIVVGLPRGGVPVAREVAAALRIPLTILVSKKIGAPFQPELALGAVSSRGVVVLDDEVAACTGQLQSYVQTEAQELARSTQEKEKNWLRRAGEQPVRFHGKRVIVVDDGIATGMTTLAALRSIREEVPARLILATPVIARQTCYRLQDDCDELIALLTPGDLSAIGKFYDDFHQVEDEEMLVDLIAAKRLPPLKQQDRAAPGI